MLRTTEDKVYLGLGIPCLARICRFGVPRAQQRHAVILQISQEFLLIRGWFFGCHDGTADVMLHTAGGTIKVAPYNKGIPLGNFCSHLSKFTPYAFPTLCVALSVKLGSPNVLIDVEYVNAVLALVDSNVHEPAL